MPTTFNFLGFTHVWGKSRKGSAVVRQLTAKVRLARMLKAVNQRCRLMRHRPWPPFPLPVTRVSVRNHQKLPGFLLPALRRRTVPFASNRPILGVLLKIEVEVPPDFMKLTETALRNIKPDGRQRKLFDGDGLYLLVKPNGLCYWRMKYRFNGIENAAALGAYPRVTLKRAREKRREVRDQLDCGIDPSAMRKAEKRARANTFEAVSREWLAKHKRAWSDEYAGNIRRRLEQHLFPWIGSKPIKNLTAADVLEPLQRIEKRGKIETAHRARANCSEVFRYAVATRRAERDPTVDLKGALSPVKERHYASVRDSVKVGQLLRAIDGYDSKSLTVNVALRLLPLVFVRPGELRLAKWSEFDLDGAEWRIPEERMKMRIPHIVPLSRQSVALLRELHPLTGPHGYVFPSILTGSRPISENTINAALRKLGYSRDEMTGHGFRSIASTLLNEQGWNPDAIERQLSHGEQNDIRAAYNHADYLPLRRRMMQVWADCLDTLRQGKKLPARADRETGDVIPMTDRVPKNRRAPRAAHP